MRLPRDPFEFRTEQGEQTAVAATLANHDAEITAPQARLAKARQFKQGMMRVLLTGRIRRVALQEEQG